MTEAEKLGSHKQQELLGQENRILTNPSGPWAPEPSREEAFPEPACRPPLAQWASFPCFLVPPNVRTLEQILYSPSLPFHLPSVSHYRFSTMVFFISFSLLNYNLFGSLPIISFLLLSFFIRSICLIFPVSFPSRLIFLVLFLCLWLKWPSWFAQDWGVSQDVGLLVLKQDILGRLGWLVTLSFDCYPWLSSIPSPSSSLLHFLPWCFICLFASWWQRGKKRKGVIGHRYVMLTLQRKLYLKALELSFVASAVISCSAKCVHPKRHRCVFFHFSETRPAKWPTPEREQDNPCNMMDVPLSCFLWFCLAFVWLVLCAAHVRAEISSFLEGKTFADYESQPSALIICEVFRVISGLLPLWFGKRNNSNK